MMESISFKALARTIDHLGREQIADAPTAVSELWKNSFDAYSRNVSLTIFDGSIPTATISDDGHGMSRDEFINRWLTVGTESKLSEVEAKESDRNGLPIRIRQGQKGIGRLSCAALGHLALVISKRVDNPFAAALIDWRLFENPYLLLGDIALPVFAFPNKDDLLLNLGSMRDILIGNLWGDNTNVERKSRLDSAWKQFDELEARQNRDQTKRAIEDVVIADVFSERQLEPWSTWNGSSQCGTIVMLAGLSFDLQALLTAEGSGAQDDTVLGAKRRCFQTLSSFTDPFNNSSSTNNEFHYSINTLNAADNTTFLSDEREFDYSNFDMLEHIVDGEVDVEGNFSGRIKSFGEWLEGDHSIEPLGIRIPSRRDTIVGGFKFKIGAYEGIRNKSSMTDEQYAFIKEQSENYSGLFVYRDDLRVQPFGRPEYDFFEIEKRRTEQAGREFWSHRRMFGSIDISSMTNPNLRDKAGREGLIDNLSAKVFREIVQNILMTTARRYFGYDVEERAPKIAKIVEANKAIKAKVAQEKLAERQRTSFRTKVRRQTSVIKALDTQLDELGDSWATLKRVPSEEAIMQFRSTLMQVESKLHELYVGDLPAGMKSFEQEFGGYAQYFKTASDKWDTMDLASLDLLNRVVNARPEEVFRRERQSRSLELERIAKELEFHGQELLDGAKQRTHAITDEYVRDFSNQMLDLNSEVASKTLPLSVALDRLGSKFSSARSDLEQLLSNLNSTFEALSDNIDLNFVATSGLDELTELRAQFSIINALAQLGVTVEIIGHELETLDAIITQGLKAFPKDWTSLRVYRRVVSAHEALTERLRFLSPLKLSGAQSKEEISGQDIEGDLRAFFGEDLKREHIELEATDQFKKLKVFERRSRVVPVFLNLANNARYWLAHNSPPGGRILIDVRDGKVIFSDDGPGVEPADVSHLFSLYFTRRSRGGRGVGLYLCRTNLAAGGHQIWYGTTKPDQILKGANFVIRFMAGADDVRRNN